MNSRIRGFAAMALTGVAVGVATFAGMKHFEGTVQTRPAIESAPKAASALRVTFEPGSPQLAELEMSTVALEPLPLAASLPARIALDEDHTSRVMPPLAGRLISVLAKAGDVVRAGQPLAMVDAPEVGAALADAEKARSDLARKDQAYKRAGTLFDGEVLARRDLEAAQSDREQAAAELSRARARLQNLRLGSSRMSGEQYALMSSVAGTVVDRQTNLGMEMRPDQANPAFVVSDLRHLWIIIDTPESFLPQMAIGQAVSVEPMALPGKTFRGRITSISASVDPGTRRVQARAEVDNPGGLLRPDMYARVDVLAPAAAPLPRVPISALVSEGVKSFVFVQTAPSVFDKRDVVASLQTREFAYIATGLKAGEAVVSRGALLLNSELAIGTH
ncbi:MAG: efflux RND transporter periplasmic adaptor subunit [Burkholderiaceae bacterium]|nr:efflux RND transporter periplasmic adaptor subunit [Burkholderiaceae bacterium]